MKMDIARIRWARFFHEDGKCKKHVKTNPIVIPKDKSRKSPFFDGVFSNLGPVSLSLSLSLSLSRSLSRSPFLSVSLSLSHSFFLSTRYCRVFTNYSRISSSWRIVRKRLSEFNVSFRFFKTCLLTWFAQLFNNRINVSAMRSPSRSFVFPRTSWPSLAFYGSPGLDPPYRARDAVHFKRRGIKRDQDSKRKNKTERKTKWNEPGVHIRYSERKGGGSGGVETLPTTFQNGWSPFGGAK